MNTSKIVKALLVIFIVSVLAGCSDQYSNPTGLNTSTGISGQTKQQVTEQKNEQEGNAVSEMSALSVDNTFFTQLRLKPFRSYTFNYSNTGLLKISAVDIEHLSVPSPIKKASSCEDLSIYGPSKNDYVITCHTRGLDLKELTVENLSSKMIDLNVSLYGIKAKKSIKDQD